MNFNAFHLHFAALIFAAIPEKVLWPYCAGLVILAAGIFTVSKEVLRTHGTDRLLALAPLFFAIPMAVFGSQHFTETRAVATLVPKWLPAHLFWTYFVGSAVIAAALGIVTKLQARLSAFLLAVLLICFVLTIHVPNIMRNPKSVIAWAILLRDLAFSGGALALAGTQTGNRKAAHINHLVTIARIFISVPTIFYGVQHFLHPQFMPGIDFDRSVPTHIPGHTFWSYLAGTVLVLAGAAILLNKKTRIAAMCLGITALVLVLFVYLPILASQPSDINDGLNFLVSMLAFSGTALLLAKALPA